MRLQPLLVFNLALVSAITAYALSPARAAEPAKTHKVKVGALKLTVPESWAIKKKTNNSFHLAQFSLPKVEGDKDETVCDVWFLGLSAGSINENVQRWIDEFDPKDRKVKVTNGKSPEGDYLLADISGTWNRPVTTPEGGLKIVRTPSGRMVGLAVSVPKAGNYYVELMGLDKTVAANLDALRAAVGADAKSEKDDKAFSNKTAEEKTAKKPTDEKTSTDHAAKK